MYIKVLSVIALLCMMVIPSLEGRSHSSSRHHAQVIKKKTQEKNHIAQKRQPRTERKRPTRVVATKQIRTRRELAARKKQQKVAVAGRSQRHIIPAKAKPQPKRVTLQRKKNLSSRPIPNKRTKHKSLTSRAQSKQKPLNAQKNLKSRPILSKGHPKKRLQKASTRRNIPQKKVNYLSLLPYHNQCAAKDGGLDKLLAKEMKGQGQTVAVIELSGEWKALKDAINNNNGRLSPALKANYKSNFLTPIGGPGLHPEQMNDWLRDKGNPNHGSSVSSVVLDLAPQTKILPVSTYYCPHSSQFYDTADALMDLSKRPEVSIINMSSGFTDFEIESTNKRKKDGAEERLVKHIYRPKVREAFKAIAKAGKVVVIAAGNEEKPIDVPQFLPSGHMRAHELAGYLMQELDPETRKSIILAGSCALEERKIAAYSNKPGALKNAQEAFLLAPGHYYTSFDNDVAIGTSYAAPYICAAIANLTSNRKFSPRRAVQALKDTAERRPDVGTYGRGIIRADKALELLERSGGG